MVHRLVSNYHGSNTYIIPFDDSFVIIIDPGDPDISNILYWLESHEKKVLAVFLTHEHSDHCSGVDKLFEVHNFLLFSSSECASNIVNSKQNFSFYINEIETFKIKTKSITLFHDQLIKLVTASGATIGSYLNDVKYHLSVIHSLDEIKGLNGSGNTNSLAPFILLKTPGHSPGSSCIIYKNFIFTGDTLLRDYKTPLTFPHSNRNDYFVSLHKILKIITPGMVAFPGHGSPFSLDDSFLINKIHENNSSNT